MKIVEMDRSGANGLFSVLITAVGSLINRLDKVDITNEWPLGKPIPNVYNREVA
jgi:hypothetical protein